MDIELKEVRDFLANIPPFDRLPITLVEELTHAASIRYIRRGSPLPPDNTTQNRLYIIRKGAISLLSTKGTLLGKLSDGDICTIFCTPETHEKFTINVNEDTLVYTIPCDTLSEIVKDYSSVSAFIQKTASQRLNDAVSTMKEEAALLSPLMHMSTKELMHSPVVSITVQSTIYQAAKKMTDTGISSLLVTDEDKAIGILTDRDITKRCVAAQISPKSFVDTIMTKNMLSVTSDSSAYDPQAYSSYTCY